MRTDQNSCGWKQRERDRQKLERNRPSSSQSLLNGAQRVQWPLCRLAPTRLHIEVALHRDHLTDSLPTLVISSRLEEVRRIPPQSQRTQVRLGRRESRSGIIIMAVTPYSYVQRYEECGSFEAHENAQRRDNFLSR
jgi:hypothetical protein